MILTNNYQRIIKLGREGPTTTPTQTKGQRSSLGFQSPQHHFQTSTQVMGPVYALCKTKMVPRKPPTSEAAFGSSGEPANGRYPRGSMRNQHAGGAYMGGTDNKQQRRRQAKATEAVMTNSSGGDRQKQPRR